MPVLAPQSRRLTASCCLAAGLLLAALPARAELVVLSDGSFFKVRSYELVGERMRLTLPSGGRVTLALSRIERVVADEVPLPEEPEAATIAAPPEEFSWRFDDSHPVPATPFGELIYASARRHAVNPALVAAVVAAESAFQPAVVSSKGARGLMQLMPATARRFGVGERELFDPARNLEAGVVYLRWLLERYGSDLRLALAAYNAGEGTVDRFGGAPPYRETRGYVRRVYAALGLADNGAAGTSPPARAGAR
jgi:Transglycosylase SLT domain